MTDPTTGTPDALDDALCGMARPAIDPARREMHIAAALDALESAESPGNTPNNVVSLASRRRTRVMALTAVAAASLFAVGIGIGRVSAPTAESPSAVKNAALDRAPGDTPSTTVAGCPDLVLDAPTEFVTSFGTYALYRTGEAGAAALIVVDTAACTIVTRIAAPTAAGG